LWEEIPEAKKDDDDEEEEFDDNDNPSFDNLFY
jgi:hypothetical protein